MRTAVLIPYRGGCPHRGSALEHILARYATTHPDWQVALGEPPAGPWVKARAVSAAREHAAGADVLVIADADVWTTGLRAAVDAVCAGAAWAIPHRGVQRLTEPASSAFIAGADWPGLELAERAYLGVAGGGITVLHRDTLAACPLDPRFEGWGSEDESWGFALRTMVGAPVRVKVALVHLWHPPQPRANRARGSLASWDLRKRYARALHNTTAMTALLEEAKTADDAHHAAEPTDDDHQPLGVREHRRVRQRASGRDVRRRRR